MSVNRHTKSIEALSASFNRALAGARQPQVAAGRRAQVRTGGPDSDSPTNRHRADHFDRLASRRRTNLLIGTVARFRAAPRLRGHA
jgi:hypothetical protein